MRPILFAINGVSLLLCAATIIVGVFLTVSLLIFLVIVNPRYESTETSYDRVIYGNWLDEWVYGLTVDFISPLGILLCLFLLLFGAKHKKVKMILFISIGIWILIEVGIFTFFADMNDFLE